MRILHYSLGFPPYRSGGLTKFCMDLMKQQVKEGNDVSLLWPGTMQLSSERTKIKEHKKIDGIESYEVINPVPVSYDEGIRDFEAFKKIGDKSIYLRLLEKVQPDVIHIHTLMGLHKSLLLAAKEKNVRLIFTTHDFYPICPKVTMFKHGQVCESAESCEKCGVCNNTALSLKKIKILQSPLYRSLKDSVLVKRLRKQHRDEYLSDSEERNKESVGTSEDFNCLRDHYYSMLKLMDIIHYNSTVTKEVYERFFVLPSNHVINITHADIADHRRTREFDSDILRIRYLGPQSAAKGYYLLKSVLDDLWKERKNFRMDVHFTPAEVPPYMNCHPRYGMNELERIFDDTDILVCPSIWYETFGYTVLEALSYGTPVIISDHVGAKDVIDTESGMIFNAGNPAALKGIIQSITREKLRNANRVIVTNQNILTIDKMSSELYKLYEGAENG